MANYTFTINGETRSVENVPEWLPMLWVVRDKLGITGPKYGCGVGACRACTSHIVAQDGSFEEVQLCTLPAERLSQDGRAIRTIEGLAEGGQLHPVQEAWLEVDVPQCGFCQPGQIMTACALLANNGGEVTDDDIDQIENVCRCGTYARIRRAIKTAAANMDGGIPGTGSGDPGDDPPTEQDPQEPVPGEPVPGVPGDPPDPPGSGGNRDEAGGGDRDRGGRDDAGARRGPLGRLPGLR